jgi:filamentous hemagglutinin family protein
MTISLSRLQRLPIPAAIARSFAIAGLLAPGLAVAGGLPGGGTVVAGAATIANPSSSNTVITQTSNAAVINWQQFNIGSGDYVQFIQPSSSSVVLNRVIGGVPSQILGDLSANGRVFLINSSGILFGKGSQIDVGGLVASTMNISNSDFMAGHYVFSGGSGAGSSVVNDGTIHSADGGFVVLAGDYVNNTGLIQARLGQVVLASGAATTLDLDGSGLISFAVNQATLAQKAGVSNAGEIIADGGRVVMTAQTAHDLLGSAVNNTGLVRAQGIANHDGQIELTASGGNISDSGTLDASNAGGTGGSVQIDGDRDIAIQKGAQILASGGSGGKVSIVADGLLNFASGSLISALGNSGAGGVTELSGHGELLVRGGINLGQGGRLLIDPTNISIAAGSGSSSSASGNETVFQGFIESQLQSGVAVQLVASNSITLSDLSSSGGALDGRASGSGGSLLLGIGSVNGSGSYVAGGSGSISFDNTANSIFTDGVLTLDAGTTGGTVSVGALSGSSVQVTGLGSVSTGTVTGKKGAITISGGNITLGTVSGSSLSSIDVQATGALSMPASSLSAGSITVFAASGGVSFGALTASSGAIHVSDSAGSIVLNGGDSAKTSFAASAGGNITFTNNVAAGTSLNLTAGGQVSANGGGNALTSGTTANVSGANLALFNLTGGSSVALTATNGDLDGNTIRASNGTLQLTDTGGSINTGSLVATKGAVTVTGNTGGTSDNGININGINSSGALQVTNKTGVVTLGSVSAGSINVSDTGGNVVLNGGDTSTGAITVSSSNNITYTNNVTASGALSLTAAGQVSANGGGNALSAGTTANVTASSLALFNVTGGSGVTLSATGGNNSFNVATTTGGPISVSDSGGVIQGGSVGANGSGTGSVSVTGDKGITLNSVSASASFNATDNSGNITLGSTSAGLISVTASNGNIVLNGGDSTLGGAVLGSGTSPNAAGSIAITASAGNITYTNNVSADGTLNFVASGAISANGGGNSVSASSTSSLTAGSLALFNVTGSSVALTATGGNASFNVAASGSGALTVVDTGGTISGNIAAATSGSGLNNGSVSISGAQGVTLSSGSASTSFSVTNGSGNVTLGNLSAGSVNVTNSNGNVTLNGGDSTSAGGAITVSTPKGNITYTNNVNASGALSFTASGQVSANGGGNALNAGTTATVSGANLALFNVNGAGGVALTATAGDLTGNTETSSGGTVQLVDSGGSIGVNSLSSPTGGITVTGNTGTATDQGITLSGVSTGGSFTLNNQTGTVTLGSISAGSVNLSNAGNIVLNGGDSTSGGGAFSANAGGNLTYTNNVGASGALNLTAAGQVSANGGGNTLSAGGSVSVTGGSLALFNVSGGSGITLSASGGDLDANSLTVSSGTISATTTAGNINIASLGANSGGSLGGVTMNSSGSLNFGASTLTAGTISLAAGAGGLSFGALTATSGGISLTASNGVNINAGNLSAAQGITAVTAGSGNLSVGSIDSQGGNTSLTVASGSLSFGPISGVNVALSTGQSYTLSGASINASGSFSATAAGDLVFDQSTINGGQIALNGNNITLSNGTALTGNSVTITGSGAVLASGSGSTINAGGLAVSGASIDLTDASLTVGSGSAGLGSDSALIDGIRSRSPNLAPSSSTPNAAFSSPGGVALGAISVAGGYLFIQAPTLVLPTALSGSTNMFLNFLPSDPTQQLNIDLSQGISGVNTVVFGGTSQTGNIQIGDGSERFALTNGVNLIFSTKGTTLYPDTVSSNGQVVVLGAELFAVPPITSSAIPQTTQQYTTEEPQGGPLAYTSDSSGNSGDNNPDSPYGIDYSGVNAANRGHIDMKTTGQQPLSCGVGGMQ